VLSVESAAEPTRPEAGHADPTDTSVGVRPNPTIDDVPRSGPISALIAAAYIGIVILVPRLSSNLAWVDFVIALLILAAIAGMRFRGSAATAALARAAPWLWLVLFGSILGLNGVGVPLWSLSSLSRTAMAIGAFFCFWYLLDIRRAERTALVATAVAMAVTVVYVLAFENAAGRSGALFDRSNYLGHYSALAGVLLLWSSRRWWSRAGAVIAIAIGLYTSASFGAMAMVLVALGVVLVRAAARNSAILAAALIVFGSVSLLLVVTTTDVGLETEDAAVTDTISQKRFERSQEGRIRLWGMAWEAFTDRPLGVGPDGVAKRAIALSDRGRPMEIHADAFGYLVERSVPGLIGYVGLWTVIWRAARPRGLARIMIPMILTAGIFRETMHFRHSWLLLALAFVLDTRRAEADQRDDEDEASERAAEPLAGGGAAALPA
jgi:hypothetical protein